MSAFRPDFHRPSIYILSILFPNAWERHAVLRAGRECHRCPGSASGMAPVRAATLARFPLPSAPVEGYGSCRRSPRPAMSRSFASFLLIVCTMFWGFAFIAQKSAMDSMGPLTFAGVRFLIGGLLVLPLALHERRRRPIRLTASHWSFIAAMSTVFFLGSWLQQAGLATTT